MLTFLWIDLFILNMTENTIIFECLECGEEEETTSELFSGRVICTCINCLSKDDRLEGPTYEIEILDNPTLYPPEFLIPSPTISSLFLVNCKNLRFNPKTRIIKGFAFDHIVDDITHTLSARIINGPKWSELRHWFDSLSTSRLITRHIPE